MASTSPVQLFLLISAIITFSQGFMCQNAVVEDCKHGFCLYKTDSSNYCPHENYTTEMAYGEDEEEKQHIKEFLDACKKYLGANKQYRWKRLLSRGGHASYMWRCCRNPNNCKMMVASSVEKEWKLGQKMAVGIKGEISVVTTAAVGVVFFCSLFS